MDTISQPALNTATVDHAGANQARQAEDRTAFQAIYRESLSQSPAARRFDPASDLRTFGQQFRDLEKSVAADRSNMLRVLMPPPREATAANGDYRPQSAGDRGRYDDAGSRMLARDSDRVGSTGARPIFSDRVSDRAPPVLQAALGLPDGADAGRVDFAGEIKGLSVRIDSAMEAIRERIADRQPKSPDEMMRHNSEVQGLIRETDALNSERSMIMSLHLTSHQESRTRMMSAFEHVVGMTKKINEIFNQLKQGS